jgi:hypothetical protein
MLAQIDGSPMIDAAAKHSWEAAAVAIVLLVMLGSMGWLMRALWTINQRLAERVTNLEGQLADRLVAIVEQTSVAITANTQMLERTATAIDKLEKAVEHSLRTQDTLMARMEAAPCLMEAALSEETRDRLATARETARKRISEKHNEDKNK